MREGTVARRRRVSGPVRATNARRGAEGLTTFTFTAFPAVRRAGAFFRADVFDAVRGLRLAIGGSF